MEVPRGSRANPQIGGLVVTFLTVILEGIVGWALWCPSIKLKNELFGDLNIVFAQKVEIHS